MSASLVSVVLPTCDGIATLPEVLGAIRAQRTHRRIEVIAVDSSSTDGTLALLRRDADDVIVVAREAFDHGLSRNLGIARATGDFVIVLVQDAVPVGDHWLEALLAPMVEDARIAGTFARQEPRADASDLARAALRGYVATTPTPRTSALDQDAFARLTPDQRLQACAFDNVCACIRRSVWERYPFRSTTIAEDLEWAREVLLAGYRVAYVPEAAVRHSHDRSLAYEYRRTRLLHARLGALFELRTIPTLPALLRSIAATTRAHLEWERSPRRLPRALGLAVVWPLAQFLGGRDGVGRPQRRLPR